MDMKKRVIRAGLAVMLVVAGIAPVIATAPAGAQSDPSVTVDLSVINDLGRDPAAAPAAAPGWTGENLRFPGTQAPHSRLHVPPPSGSRQAVNRGSREPAPAAPRRQARVEKPRPAQPKPTEAPKAPAPAPAVQQPAPVPAPAPVVAAPVPAPVPQASVTPRPLAAPAPEQPRETANVAPPPAPVLTEPNARPPAAKPPAPALTPPSAPPPAAVVAPAPAAPAAKPQQGAELAARTSGSGRGALKEGDSLSILFENGSDKMPESARTDLDRVIALLNAHPDLRMRILGYAGGPALTSSKARRLSLSRALDVRAYLMKNGVRSTRIDVRALGDRVDNEPVNRVDVTIAER